MLPALLALLSFIATVETTGLQTGKKIEATFLRRTEDHLFMRANGVLSELVLLPQTKILEILNDVL